jgi:hypothetical protein
VDPSHEFSDRDYLHRPFTRLDDSFIEVDFHFESQQGSEPQVVASEPCHWMSTDAFRLCDWADYHRGEWREQLEQSRLSVDLAGSKDPGYAFVETCCHQSPETGRSFWLSSWRIGDHDWISSTPSDSSSEGFRWLGEQGKAKTNSTLDRWMEATDSLWDNGRETET